MSTNALTVPTTTTGPVAPTESPTPPNQDAPPRPEWLPEGFDSPEDLAAAYQEAIQGKQPDPSTEQPQESTEGLPAPTTDEAVGEFVKGVGFDPVELNREIAMNGDINPDARVAIAAKLEEAGLSPKMIDEYISGQNAIKDQCVRDVMSITGGEEGWKEMAEWAASTMSEAELGAFNKIMLSADIDAAKLLVGNLYARFRNEVPSAGKRLKAQTGATARTAGDVFHSWEQQQAAQADPRYAKDPAYRKAVADKIARTLSSGVTLQ